MKGFIYLITLLLLASCGGSKKSDSTIITDYALTDSESLSVDAAQEELKERGNFYVSPKEGESFQMLIMTQLNSSYSGRFAGEPTSSKCGSSSRMTMTEYVTKVDEDEKKYSYKTVLSNSTFSASEECYDQESPWEDGETTETEKITENTFKELEKIFEKMIDDAGLSDKFDTNYKTSVEKGTYQGKVVYKFTTNAYDVIWERELREFEIPGINSDNEVKAKLDAGCSFIIDPEYPAHLSLSDGSCKIDVYLKSGSGSYTSTDNISLKMRMTNPIREML